jgi:predicted Zn-dependent protease
MRRMLLIACLYCLATASAQAQFNLDINRLIDTAKSLGQATTEIDEPGEIEIGRDVASRLLGAAPLHPDPSLQRYVNQIGRWLASQTERPDLPWRFAVLDAPQVNAFATPGGYIFVTGGLVARMTTEAELAGVLAH